MRSFKVQQRYLKIKFIHILWRDELLFSPNIIKTINDEPDLFNRNEHCFIITSKRLYDICPYENVFLDIEHNGEKRFAELVNKYARHCEFIICHAIGTPSELVRIKNRYIKKIIWRSWGHDAFFPYKMINRKPFRNFLVLVIEKEWRRRVSNMRAVCGANIVDKIDIFDTFGDSLDYYEYSYANLKRSQDIGKEDDVLPSFWLNDFNSCCNIMVGHSGYDNDNHIEILKKLEVFRNESIHIFLVLSYGESSYIEKVEAFAREYWKDKVTIIKEMMPINVYHSFLNRIDVAVFDGIHSYALGNIKYLLRKRKKLVINQNGVLRRAFEMNAIPYLSTNEAFNLDFDVFSMPISYSEYSGVQLFIRPNEEKINELIRLFSI